jgi:acetolactate synthase I/II/III large subunit
MLKVSNFIFQTLRENGCDTVFLVTGGGAMHLNDAAGFENGMKKVCLHHEQSCAMAAEGYTRVTNKPAIVNVTTGPGAINAINGVFGAWTDSIPMIIISGQVKRATLMKTHAIEGLRQLGEQEVDIVRMVSGITKYAHCVTEPESIKYHLEKAIYEATNGRPGPVWLDIPVDVQGSMIDPAELKGFEFSEKDKSLSNNTISQISEVVERLKKAKRPIVIASNGIRLAGAFEELDRFITKANIPIVTSCFHDIIDYQHPNYVGQQGTVGDRSGNISVQSSDLVLIIGSRMPIRQISYNWENFAKNAFKIQIDVDSVEMTKPTFVVDMPITCDAKVFLNEITNQLEKSSYNNINSAAWLNWCKEKRDKYPIVLEKHKNPERPINPYHFLYELQSKLTSNDIIVTGDGAAGVVTFQTAQCKKGQILFTNMGSASMGYDLPAAIGAAVADPTRRVICLAGDGSLQMNIQELQTVFHHNLNIKIIVVNNDGYMSIRTTQKNFFKNHIGYNAETGVSFPKFEKVGNAYGIPSFTLSKFDFDTDLDRYLSMDGPVLIDVILDSEQFFEPKLSSKIMPDGTMVSASLEDMAPFLSEEEMNSNRVTDADWDAIVEKHHSPH